MLQHTRPSYAPRNDGYQTSNFQLPTTLKILLIILFFLLQACVNDRGKKRFKWTDVICNQLYVETYVISLKGTEGAERLSQYLTDSLSFRIHIGNIVQGRDYNSYECSGDTILISKKKLGQIQNTKILSVRSLKQEGRLE